MKSQGKLRPGVRSVSPSGQTFISSLVKHFLELCSRHLGEMWRSPSLTLILYNKDNCQATW